MLTSGPDHTNVDQLVLGLWGDIKTCKSTLGLTFPKPLVHFDFDLGFQRASPTLPSDCKVLKVPWHEPLQEHHLLEADVVSKSYQIPIRLPKQKVQGLLELWEEQVMPQMLLAITHPRIASLNYDTGTVLWRLATGAQLQRAQRDNPNRVNLIQIEYGTPNQEMRALIGACRNFGKNLCIIHHIGGKYEDRWTQKGIESLRVGDTWDGFSHLGALADVIARSYIETVGGYKVPKLVIETCGYTLEAEGQEIPMPSFVSLLEKINLSRNGLGPQS